MVLVALSIVEQRLDAVRAVLDDVPLNEVADQVGVHRATLGRWVTRYLTEGLPGHADRSHRPVSCPHRVAAAVEVRVAEVRREHPRWGAKRRSPPRRPLRTATDGGRDTGPAITPASKRTVGPLPWVGPADSGASGWP
jgi:transposase-like protein